MTRENTAVAELSVADRYNVIDVDSHVTEPPDLWTSRLPRHWGKSIPHVVTDPATSRERWFIGDTKLAAVASTAFAGWREFPPAHPPTLAEADPAAWNAPDRLVRMDEYGLQTQLLYPNLLGFNAHVLLTMEETQLALECVQAYNDFLVDFSSISPHRLVPLMMLPYWDMTATLEEMSRAKDIGHKGIVFGADFSAIGLPGLLDEYWSPLYAQAQDLGLSLNFHIGISARTVEGMRAFQRHVISDKVTFAKESALMMIGNASSIADVTLGGVCERYPELKFVSVESGTSWLPFVLDSLDWQWLNSGGHDAFPDRLLPSEYFRRQIFGSFWFETTMLKQALELFPDNFMFETDFPHPTSLSPGPASYADQPREVLERLSSLDHTLLGNVLHDNAARVYGLD
jgi:predicted TIM-barrel fold metal-dependent hydrolase